MTQNEKNQMIKQWLDGGKYSIEAYEKDIVPDFYADETANALVLEKLPYPALSFNKDNGQWYCVADRVNWVSIGAYSTDRKMAICEAAITFIEDSKKKPA